DGDLKSAEKYIGNGKIEREVYDDDTGRIRRFALETDNPWDHVERAHKLFDPNDAKRQDARSAEREWKKAIAAADNLPLEAAELIKFEAGRKELVDLPSFLRMETANFYLANAKPDEAKAMLEQALQNNPVLKKQQRFKQLVEAAMANVPQYI